MSANFSGKTILLSRDSELTNEQIMTADMFGWTIKREEIDWRDALSDYIDKTIGAVLVSAWRRPAAYVDQSGSMESINPFLRARDMAAQLEAQTVYHTPEHVDTLLKEIDTKYPLKHKDYKFVVSDTPPDMDADAAVFGNKPKENK